MKLSETVREIIRLGDASRAYWDRELPKRHPRYPVIRPGEDSGPPPPEDAQIQALLESLPEDQVYALACLTYVGGGDFSADHLTAAYEHIKEAFPSKEMAIAKMMGTTALAEELEDAVQETQKRHIDLDSLKCANTVAV